MTNQSPSLSSDRALRVLKLDYIAWQEAKARNLAFYTAALVRNELSVIPGKEHTTRKANCDICNAPQEPGIRKFFYKENRETGFQSFYFHPCSQCWQELMNSVPMQYLLIAQIPQGVTTLSAV
jgi:hypothetical protein